MIPLYLPNDIKLQKKLRQGALIAYPTEGIWGFGCLPDASATIKRLSELKSRENKKGFILIAATWSQIADYLVEPDVMYTRWRQHGQGFVTSVFAASEQCPTQLCAQNHSIAIRISTHPTVVALCNGLDSAIISTSANLNKHPPAKDIDSIQRKFPTSIDAIVIGELGNAQKPSRLIDLRHTPPQLLRP